MSTLELTQAQDNIFSAGTVEEAVDHGLRHLGMDREEAEIRVLQEASRGFLGFGSRPARVEIVPRIALAEDVKNLAQELLGKMGIQAGVRAVQSGFRVKLSIDSGESDGLLIGRKGETLEALQHVLLRMSARKLPRIQGVEVDISGYRRRREDALVQLAASLAERVRRTGRRGMTEPLPPGERRIVHRVLAESEGIQTHTGGSGINRRVIVTPAGRRSRGR